MRRLSMIAIFIILALVFVGCSSSNDPKEKAEEFLNMYYGQYEKKDKIKEIANQSNLGDTNSGEDLLTSSAKGWIKIVEEEGKLKVDGFKVY